MWCNPPYGAEASRWLAKLAEHGNGIALIFARTDTALLQDYVFTRAHGILFLRGRLAFCDRQGKPARTNAGAPSVLVAYGERNADALCTCGLAGHFIALTPLPSCYGRAPQLFAEVASA